MSSFEKFVYFLQGEMTEPVPFGWFHLLWIALTIGAIIYLTRLKPKNKEKTLKVVLATYGIVAFILEALKQISWSFNYDPVTQLVTWDFEWYSFPFQLCTTPIYVSLICLFLKKNKLRDSLFSYLSFVTILGSIMTIILPESCFVSDILVNIHTMWLHCGSLVVSVYLLTSKEVKISLKNLLNSIKVFLFFVFVAQVLNIIIYNSGILGDENFNMFYISPYFISHLPVFNTVQQSVPYLIYLLFYIVALSLGAVVIYGVSKLFEKLLTKEKN